VGRRLRMDKFKVNKTTCSCDMTYLLYHANPDKLIEEFLKNHPFICGALTGYAMKNGADKLGELIFNTGKECMEKGGWGSDGVVQSQEETIK
jgi:hypothetical protein